ncbi:hypothetical protein [Polyangium fumosum]|uniref:Uncharacterized protein n=1 Tax=Polyangium fumosum TaxID=889272 RepID=A0A4U1JHW4_9BACT|nr:hypothetical protein [Polyangium fumosum]TKD10326.1 hypothetical protein E8A74_07695 [Polyangium fumosum]
MIRHTPPKTIALGASALLFTAAFGTSCEQPPILCEVASSAYIVKYYPKDAGSDCLKLPGERVGMSVYNPPKGDDREIDATQATVAIQAHAMGVLADDAKNKAGATDPDSNHKQYSLGDYAARPDADDLCATSGLSVAEQHIPETAYTDADGHPAIYPETRLAYEWRDVRVYMTFATSGNAATGEVTITRDTEDPATGDHETCTTTYVASALFPIAGCEAVDAMGQATGMPDDTRCCANADPSQGRPFGSGIHPNFKVKCDPELLLCVLDWKPGESFPPLGKSSFCGAGG